MQDQSLKVELVFLAQVYSWGFKKLHTATVAYLGWKLGFAQQCGWGGVNRHLTSDKTVTIKVRIPLKSHLMNQGVSLGCIQTEADMAESSITKRQVQKEGYVSQVTQLMSLEESSPSLALSGSFPWLRVSPPSLYCLYQLREGKSTAFGRFQGLPEASVLFTP